MWRRVALVRNYISDEIIVSIIRVKRINKLEKLCFLFNIVFLRSVLQLIVTANVVHIPDNGGDGLVGNVGSYKRHTV
jgi:hypothetical protein